jgi:hypothetical protein
VQRPGAHDAQQILHEERRAPRREILSLAERGFVDRQLGSRARPPRRPRRASRTRRRPAPVPATPQTAGCRRRRARPGDPRAPASGQVSVPATFVEPLIAVSIAWVALENIFAWEPSGRRITSCHRTWYRRVVVLPASAAMAGVAIYRTVTRLPWAT